MSSKDSSIPVLMYHHVSPHAGDTVTVTPEAFGRQMEWLAGEGYHTLTLTQLAQFIGTGLAPPGPCIVLTFDDGWLDNYLYALPILQRYSFHAVFFLVTDRVDAASAEAFSSLDTPLPDHAGAKACLAEGNSRRVVLTWDLVREMESSGGAEFHSHTAIHVAADTLMPDELRTSILRAAATLKRELGSASDWLCWPYGRYSEQAVEVAVVEGYGKFFTIHPGRVTCDTSLHAIPRLEVKGERLDEFIALVAGESKHPPVGENL